MTQVASPIASPTQPSMSPGVQLSASSSICMIRRSPVVVEREADRLLSRPPTHLEAELLEARNDRLAIVGRRAADEHDVVVGVDLPKRAGAVPDGAAGPLRCSGDDVEHEVPDDRCPGMRRS